MSLFSLKLLYRWLLPIVFPVVLCAQAVVNPPQPISNRVIVNAIQVSKADGTKANAWGSNKTVEFYIKNEINRILNQSGIDVQFTAIVEYVNDFAYDGSPADYTLSARPQNHLNMIVNAAGAPEFTDVDVINLYFVETVPGFSNLNDNTANGLAFIDGNGIAMHVGTNLLGFKNGRDLIAGVLAHEIGHNLGLPHTEDGIANLMSPLGTSEQITPAQTTLIFTDSVFIDGADFAKPLADTRFSGWAIDNAVSSAIDGDDDADGVPNLLEFALGLDPGRSDSSRIDTGQFSAAPNLELHFNKQASALDDAVVYSVEVAGILGSWNQAGVATDSSLLVDTSERIHARAFGGTKAFMRLVVSAPASPEARTASARSASDSNRIVDASPSIYSCLMQKTAYPVAADLK